MTENAGHATDAAAQEGDLLTLSILALLIGAVSGLLGAAFRIAVDWGDRLRNGLIRVEHHDGLFGLLFFVSLCASACALAAWLVQRYARQASGSGIPHVEAVMHGLVPPAALTLAPVKFFGGMLALGAGLTLGREGPSVQIGAVVAQMIGVGARRSWADCRLLLAAGAGAGLATAFNAPIAGAVFVLEELAQKFEHRMAIVALAASATAICVSRAIVGDGPIFTVAPIAFVSIAAEPLFIFFGALLGVFAIIFNRSLLATMFFMEERKRLPVEARAGLIGAGVALAGWYSPMLIGGGDEIVQQALSGRPLVALLPFLFLLRLAFLVLSYSGGTPGGIFAPLLALGAQAGLLFFSACHGLFPQMALEPQSFALVGMTALFAGVSRAPLTGIVLVTEMTANTTLLLPMIGACFAAMLVPTLLNNAPIYESLRIKTLQREKADPAQA